ncbi:hypothetical protein [Hydrogenophaga sp. SL48]|jgi:hypothetical protein|uniref:hypothetical protein n=1 Tax=Hydrogenophaga sp. SL48 TaxID=2806347 RepID=UPI001F43F127|nr:hypothetical protein [Hydrogenophaga sp. SL48]UJW79919.1 hypothetical protein IM738_18890 [Hydrogenophaga sp. SL48]
MKRFPATCAALSLLLLNACAARSNPDAEPPISERTYADHGCADLGEAWRDMRDHEDQLSGEVARIASGQPVTDSPRPPKDRGHAQALDAVRAHLDAIRARASRTACTLPTGTTARN